MKAKLNDDERLKTIPWVREMRSDIVEECAHLAELYRAFEVADAIRALKDKP